LKIYVSSTQEKSLPITLKSAFYGFFPQKPLFLKLGVFSTNYEAKSKDRTFEAPPRFVKNNATL
jgi:hypothetical protein